jgi:hypothetical protein
MTMLEINQNDGLFDKLLLASIFNSVTTTPPLTGQQLSPALDSRAS